MLTRRCRELNSPSRLGSHQARSIGSRQARGSTPMGLLRMLAGAAHVMGGCAMGGDGKSSVVDEWGRHRAIENLSVIDGSVFPTSLGVNPQETIYAIAAKNATALAKALA